MEIPVLIILRNNLHLSKACFKSVINQDIPVNVWLMDNGSTDGTSQWAATLKSVQYTYHSTRLSVAEAWNIGLSTLFKAYDAVMVLNNDTQLRPDTVRHLVNDGGLFVTAVGTRDPEKIKPQPETVPGFGGCLLTEMVVDKYSEPDPTKKRPHPDFSCYLIRRKAWEKVGEFDENFKIAFCEDGDYDLRLYKAGIRAYCIDLPFLHHGSMTIKNADPKEIRRIQVQADLNRKYFIKKWGFLMASEAYYQALSKTGPNPSL